MNVKLLPRLSQIAVDHLLDERRGKLNLSSGLKYVDQFPDMMSYAATGGSPASKEEFLDLRSALIAVAEKHGFPERGSAKDRAQFDADVVALLGEHHLFVPPESLRDDVWAYLSTVMVPELVVWRFGGTARERFHGGVRNTFQRLWMRAWSLDRGPDAEDRWGLVRELTEDAFVQIVERPSIGGDRRLSLALAEGWVRMAETAGRGAMEAIMRRAVIAFRLRNQVQMLSALDDETLNSNVDAMFQLAHASLKFGNSDELVLDDSMRADSGYIVRAKGNNPVEETAQNSGRFSKIRAIIQGSKNDRTGDR